MRPYSRSQIADGQRQEAGLRHRITEGELGWLMPGLPLPWQTWVQQVLRPEAIAVQPALCSSFVLGMDIPLLQRFAAEVPESNRLYVHSLSDAQALVFGDAGHCVKATLQQGQISDWQTSPAEASESETRLRAADATALHAAWQCFAQEMDCPANLSQFRAQVFDAGLHFTHHAGLDGSLRQHPHRLPLVQWCQPHPGWQGNHSHHSAWKRLKT